MSRLEDMVDEFADKWGPLRARLHQQFLGELRELLDAHVKAALKHESLPHSEEHGDPM